MRSASVRCVTYVELAELSREDFAAVLAGHSTFRRIVQDKTNMIHEQRLAQKKKRLERRRAHRSSVSTGHLSAYVGEEAARRMSTEERQKIELEDQDIKA